MSDNVSTSAKIVAGFSVPLTGYIRDIRHPKVDDLEGMVVILKRERVSPAWVVHYFICFEDQDGRDQFAAVGASRGLSPIFEHELTADVALTKAVEALRKVIYEDFHGPE